MGKFNIKKLPKNFRYLFTLKEIENFAEIKFKNVINSNLVNSEKFLDNQYIQSSFRGFTIQGTKSKLGWEFNLHQGDFREELLPEIHEKEFKDTLVRKNKRIFKQSPPFNRNRLL